SAPTREMDRSFDILVVGGSAIDYTIRADELPSPGHSVTGDLFLRDAGGDCHVSGEVLARAAIVLAQLEIPIGTVQHTARLAKRASVTFILDAAPAIDIPDELVALADVVTANSEEAHALSAIHVHDRASALAAARAIRRRGARCVTVGATEGRAVVSE